MERLFGAEGLAGPHAPRVLVYGLEELTPAQREAWWSPLQFWPFALIADGGWEIGIHLVQELEKRGEAHTYPNDRKATIRLWIGAPDPARVLIHEMLHIVLSGLDAVAGRPIEHLREVSCDLQTRALLGSLEETVVRLAAAILVVHRFRDRT